LREIGKQNPDLNNWINTHSKLKRNILFDATISIEEIIEGVRKIDLAMYDALKTAFTPEVYRPVPLFTYNGLNLADKINVARRIDEAGYSLLSALSK